MGSFTASTDIPCYVFPTNLSDAPSFVADSISHEVGHTLGLSHDSTKKAEYYPGSNGWGPIMGAPYQQELSQWSKGEYSGALNKEDDLKILASTLKYKSDDVGSTIGSAKALQYKAAGLLWEGTIEKSNDVDYYSFVYDGSESYMSIGGIKGVTNLDVVVKLYDSKKGLLATFDPQDTNYVTFDLTKLEQGKYYISVAGTGRSANGKEIYSDYGSLGYYQIRTGALSDFMDGYEPNYTYAKAYDLGTLVEEFSDMNMRLGLDSSEEWFKFKLPVSADDSDKIVVKYEHTDKEVDIDINLFNSQGQYAR